MQQAESDKTLVEHRLCLVRTAEWQIRQYGNK
jgi:hypothetical protein